MDYLTVTFRRAVQRALGNGFQLPFYVVAVTSDGTMMYHRYVEAADHSSDLEVEMLASYGLELGVLVPPINIFILDPNGKSGQVVLRKTSGESESEVKFLN
jgi:hypothetical protein